MHSRTCPAFLFINIINPAKICLNLRTSQIAQGRGAPPTSNFTWSYHQLVMKIFIGSIFNLLYMLACARR